MRAKKKDTHRDITRDTERGILKEWHKRTDRSMDGERLAERRMYERRDRQGEIQRNKSTTMQVAPLPLHCSVLQIL